jgi:hypothetical protein
MNHLAIIVVAFLLAGCVGGPTHDYYNPIVTGAKFKPPIKTEKVEDVKSETAKLLEQGYTLIGKTEYLGKFPEAIELTTQAKRVRANHVIYSTEFVPPTPGSWSFNLSSLGASGGSGSGSHNVKIVFFGK